MCRAGVVSSATTRCPACDGSGSVRSARGHMVLPGAASAAGDRACWCSSDARAAVAGQPGAERTGRGCGARGRSGPGPRAASPGVATPGGGRPPGDLYVTVHVAPHPLFRREGDDLHLVVPVAVHEAALGAKVEIPAVGGAARLRVPPGTHSGQRFRLRGRGAPSPRDGSRGDLVVEIRLVLPAVLDERSKALLKEFGALNGENVRQQFDEAGKRPRATAQAPDGEDPPGRRAMVTKRGGKAYYMISAVAAKYDIHPQTLRLYEREGLLKPSRTEGNTRLYSEEDLEQLETILSLTRELGVNLAGVEIILNMRRKMERMQREVNEFMAYVKKELARGLDDWEQRLSTAMVKSSPTDLVRATPPGATVDATGADARRPTGAPAQMYKTPMTTLPTERIGPAHLTHLAPDAPEAPVAPVACVNSPRDLPSLRRHWLEARRDRRRAARHALRLLATKVGDTLLADARIPRRYQHCDLGAFISYPNERLLNALARIASVRRAVSRRRQGPVLRGRARHRQDAPGRRDPARR